MINYDNLIEQIHGNGFYIIDDFLSVEHADNLQKNAHSLIAENQFKNAKIGSQGNAVNNNTIRRDQIYWLDDNQSLPAVSAYFSAMNQIAAQLNRHLFMGLSEFETHFASYPPGSFYKKHCDQFNNKKERQLSCVYYLNNEWEKQFGGELNIYNLSGELITSVLPLYNRLICFTSDLPHEVCVTKKLRLSIAGWFKTRR